MMHTKENQQSLEAVHTHTHTHTHCLYKKENGLFTRESINLENKGFICNAKILVEKLYIKYKELKVNMLFRYGGNAPYE